MRNIDGSLGHSLREAWGWGSDWTGVSNASVELSHGEDIGEGSWSSQQKRGRWKKRLWQMERKDGEGPWKSDGPSSI